MLRARIAGPLRTTRIEPHRRTARAADWGHHQHDRTGGPGHDRHATGRAGRATTGSARAGPALQTGLLADGNPGRANGVERARNEDELVLACMGQRHLERLDH